ncbi:hypothetical protein DNTS_032703 [Danionella cerebrum]|uniref:Protein OSCP1 n=1 Tax=Danionella cerebrum TaxID=2873325 RepID=A0A553Q7Q3_9TELE|nr:hypothetical protein DNTS_032703 [Danionella translucida]
MSQRTIPLLMLNLGGEMIYILEQRLRSPDENEENPQRGQWTEDDRKRVLYDVVRTMFSKAFLDELFQPQEAFTHRTLRTVLTRIVQTSIMRLNTASMDKLYDLITMAFKYQIIMSPRPQDLLLITFNHIDGIKELVKDDPGLVNQINEAQRQIIEAYTPFSDGEFQLIRQTILILLQDMQIRISVFLRDKIQKPNGRFVLQTSGPVPHGFEVPGLIRCYNEKGREVKRSRFVNGGSYTSALPEGSLNLFGDRITLLGTNIHKYSPPNRLASEELNLLAKLMGGMELQRHSDGDAGPRVSLLAFDQQEEEDGRGVSEGPDQSPGIINIQVTQDELVSKELARIAGEFDNGGIQREEIGNKGDDLLAMMDDL